MRAGTVATVLVLAGLSAPLRAAEIGKFGNWTAHDERQGKIRVCFIESGPGKQEGKYSRRGKPRAAVAHRPAEGVRNEVSFAAGYRHGKDGVVTVAIGKRSFELFTKGDGAWARSREEDDALVAAMRAGRSMTVSGTSWRGTSTRDTYSLSGFSAAHDAIGKACKPRK